jgi:hypothetical protein
MRSLSVLAVVIASVSVPGLKRPLVVLPWNVRVGVLAEPAACVTNKFVANFDVVTLPSDIVLGPVAIYDMLDRGSYGFILNQ